MSSRAGLVGCGGCRRHVRVDEGSCPFCGARVAGLAVGVAAAILASALVACDAPSVRAAYGGPPPFMQVDAGDDGAAPVPPVPTSTSTSVPVDPSSMPAPAYGGPPPFLQNPPPASTDPSGGLTAAPDAGARKKRAR